MFYELQPTQLVNARNVVSRFSLSCSSGSDSTTQTVQAAGCRDQVRMSADLTDPTFSSPKRPDRLCGPHSY